MSFNSELFFFFNSTFCLHPQMLTNLLLKCLRRACEKRFKSVAMTALGIGKLGYPPEFVARTTLAAVTDFMEQEETSLQNVNIVIFPADHSSFTVSSSILFCSLLFKK